MKNKKSRIIKLNPEISLKYQESRKKAAEDKIQANIDFLYSIKSTRKEDIPSKVWKQEPSLKLEAIAEDIRKLNKKKLEILGFSAGKSHVLVKQRKTLSKSKL